MRSCAPCANTKACLQERGRAAQLSCGSYAEVTYRTPSRTTTQVPALCLPDATDARGRVVVRRCGRGGSRDVSGRPRRGGTAAHACCTAPVGSHKEGSGAVQESVPGGGRRRCVVQFKGAERSASVRCTHVCPAAVSQRAWAGCTQLLCNRWCRCHRQHRRQSRRTRHRPRQPSLLPLRVPSLRRRPHSTSPHGCGHCWRQHTHSSPLRSSEPRLRVLPPDGLRRRRRKQRPRRRPQPSVWRLRHGRRRPQPPSGWQL